MALLVPRPWRQHPIKIFLYHINIFNEITLTFRGHMTSFRKTHQQKVTWGTTEVGLIVIHHVQRIFHIFCERILLVHFNPWKWDHYIVSNLRAPVTHWRSTSEERGHKLRRYESLKSCKIWRCCGWCAENKIRISESSCSPPLYRLGVLGRLLNDRVTTTERGVRGMRRPLKPPPALMLTLLSPDEFWALRRGDISGTSSWEKMLI